MVASLEKLIQILEDSVLRGSTTNSGFIVGDKSAVCFHSAPLPSIFENLKYEAAYRRANKIKKVRYSPWGLMFMKPTIFKAGGRPVFYEETEVAKKLLPPDEWWRIVKLDLSNKKAVVDWTHEREWRIPGDFEFKFEDCVVVVPDIKWMSRFKERAKKSKSDIAARLRGIVPMSDFYIE